RTLPKCGVREYSQVRLDEALFLKTILNASGILHTTRRFETLSGHAMYCSLLGRAFAEQKHWSGDYHSPKRLSRSMLIYWHSVATIQLPLAASRMRSWDCKRSFRNWRPGRNQMRTI